MCVCARLGFGVGEGLMCDSLGLRYVERCHPSMGDASREKSIQESVLLILLWLFFLFLRLLLYLKILRQPIHADERHSRGHVCKQRKSWRAFATDYHHTHRTHTHSDML